NGTFAIWVGTLLDIHKRLLIVCETGKEEETILRLARVGCENIAGYLDGGIDAWEKNNLPVETVSSIDSKEFASQYKNNIHVLDVRRFTEAENGHVRNTLVIPLQKLDKNLSVLDKNEPVY